MEQAAWVRLNETPSPTSRKKRLILRRPGSMRHRICYQDDEIIVTGCGNLENVTREQVWGRKDLTLFRDLADCPQCGDNSGPEFIRQALSRQSHPSSH